jgi:hypothetical protein
MEAVEFMREMEMMRMGGPGVRNRKVRMHPDSVPPIPAPLALIFVNQSLNNIDLTNTSEHRKVDQEMGGNKHVA